MDSGVTGSRRSSRIERICCRTSSRVGSSIARRCCAGDERYVLSCWLWLLRLPCKHAPIWCSCEEVDDWKEGGVGLVAGVWILCMCECVAPHLDMPSVGVGESA